VRRPTRTLSNRPGHGHLCSATFARRPTGSNAVNSIFVSTDQPDTQPTPPAAPPPAFARIGLRAAAYMCDIVIVAIPVLLVIALMSGWLQTVPPETSRLVQFMLFYFAGTAYFTVFQWLTGATPGKYLFGLEVRDDATGARPSFASLLVREAAGRPICSSFLGAGYWASLRSPKRQAWSDKLAETWSSDAPPASHSDSRWAHC
jgi:uncharacterized RDD family membrane protein YckC